MSSKQYPESLIRNRERLIEKARQLNLFSDAMAKWSLLIKVPANMFYVSFPASIHWSLRKIVLKWSLTNLHPRILLWMFL